MFYHNLKSILTAALLILSSAVCMAAPVTAPNEEADEIYAQGMDYFAQKDYLSAYPYLLQAAGYGHGNARMYIGSMFYFGYGVDLDYSEAAEWYRLAAEENNNDLAQYNLALMYYNGQGVERNHDMAMKYFEMAKANGNTMAIQAIENLERARKDNERRNHVENRNVVVVKKK